MAPLPAVLDSAARTSVNYVGGNDSALSWNSVLAVGAVMLAAMQGTLVMESADPCRISYKKWKLLLLLEALEVGVVVASEVVSFVELRGALRARLQWLYWIPPCLLTMGLLELLIDVWWTIKLGAWSRINWTPFSAVGWHEKGKRKGVKSVLEVVLLLVTAALSLVLIGWRQRWWLMHVAVDAVTAERGAKQSGALSLGALGFSAMWGLLAFSAGVFRCNLD